MGYGDQALGWWLEPMGLSESAKVAGDGGKAIKVPEILKFEVRRVSAVEDGLLGYLSVPSAVPPALR